MAYLLKRWDAIELICRVDSKYRGITIDKFHKDELIEKSLMDYSDFDFAEFVSKIISTNYKEHSERSKYILINDKNLVEATKNKKSKISGMVRMMYDLSNDIRNYKPVILSDHELLACLEYIDDKSFSNRKRVYLKGFSSNSKRCVFEGTKWQLYFADEIRRKENGQSHSYKGVSRGILHFNHFGRVEIVKFMSGKEEPKVYTGFFRFDKGESYLLIDGDANQSDEDVFQMKFYIGDDDEVEICFGFGTDSNEYFGAKTLIIEPIGKSSRSNKAPTFFPKQQPPTSLLNIPNYIWEYFDDSSLNSKIPEKITLIEDFIEWQRKGCFQTINKAI